MGLVDLDFGPFQDPGKLVSANACGETFQEAAVASEGDFLYCSETVKDTNMMADREGIIEDLLGALGDVALIVDELCT